MISQCFQSGVEKTGPFEKTVPSYQRIKTSLMTLQRIQVVLPEILININLN